MTSEIIQRLSHIAQRPRHGIPNVSDFWEVSNALIDAKDEIERLRKSLISIAEFPIREQHAAACEEMQRYARDAIS